MLKIATNSNPYRPPHAVVGMGMLIGFSGLGLLGMVVVGRGSLRGRRNSNLRRAALGGFGLALVLGVLLSVTGCGGYSAPPSSGTPRGTTTVMITGTSGTTLTHSTSVTLTVQ